MIKCERCDGVKQGPAGVNVITLRQHSFPKLPIRLKFQRPAKRKRGQLYRWKTIEKGVAHQCRSCGAVVAGGQTYASLEKYRKAVAA
jgi:hypothetical protein